MKGFPCGRLAQAPVTRREMLARCAHGFGAVALAALLAEAGFDGVGPARADESDQLDPLSPRPPHHRARARGVIFLYMDGGPSQMDTFDPKPRLRREHGRPFAMAIEPTQFNNNGSTLASPWEFRPYGQ